MRSFSSARGTGRVLCLGPILVALQHRDREPRFGQARFVLLARDVPASSTLRVAAHAATPYATVGKNVLGPIPKKLSRFSMIQLRTTDAPARRARVRAARW